MISNHPYFVDFLTEFITHDHPKKSAVNRVKHTWHRESQKSPMTLSSTGPGFNIQKTMGQSPCYSWVSAISIVKHPTISIWKFPWDFSYTPSGNLLHTVAMENHHFIAG